MKVIAIGYGFLGTLELCYLMAAFFFWLPLPPISFTALAVLYLTLAFGIWQLSNFARWIAIGWQSWELVLFVTYRMNPAYWEAFRAKFDSASMDILWLLIATVSSLFMKKVVWGSLVIYCLLTRKAAFQKVKL